MVGTGTSDHICFYADGSDCRPRRCERPMKWQQQTLVGRGRRSSGSVEVAGPEAHRLDKLALPRRCAMLMGSACPWKLEHVCVTFLGCQGILTTLWSHFTAKTIDLGPTIFQVARGRRKRAATTPASLIGGGSSVQSAVGLANESCPKSYFCLGKFTAFECDMKTLKELCRMLLTRR